MSAKSPVEKDVPYSTDYDKAASLYRLTLYDLNMLPHIFCRGIRMLSTANAPKCSEICFIASSNPSVWCIMHSGNARQTWNEPVVERGRRLYFCARQKAHIYVPYSEFQIEVENHNLSGLLYGVSCGTKCFLLRNHSAGFGSEYEEQTTAGPHSSLFLMHRTASLKSKG